MKLKCFGIARDIIAKGELSLDSGHDINSVGELKNWIFQNFPEMRSLNGFMIAVDQEYANDEQEIKANSEIAIIPPVSGG